MPCVEVLLSDIFQCWILIPIAYFGNLWGSPTYNIMSNGVFLKNGSDYPFNDLSGHFAMTFWDVC